jgi:drug/metabolite transporter (DMT)-like permease
MRSLIKRPLWLLGVILSFGVSSIFYLTAQVLIGPALIPGLMAFGLIVLALGSIKIVGEKLKREEILGILFMILGTFLLGVSGLSIDIAGTNLLEIGFIIRTTVLVEKFKGILLAILSGFMFTLSNFWVSPLMGLITDIFSGTFNLAQIVIFMLSVIILILTNVFGLATIQLAYRVGQASNMVPIQQVPTLIAPIFIYFLIFLLAPPSIFSVIYLITGIILIGTSSFLLGKRSAQMEEIK